MPRRKFTNPNIFFATATRVDDSATMINDTPTMAPFASQTQSPARRRIRNPSGEGRYCRPSL